MTKYIKKIALASLTAMTVGIALVGCSSGGDSSGGDAGNKGPIKVGMVAPVDVAGAGLPDVLASAKVGIETVNAAGGVNGRPLELVFCDDKADPAISATCAEQLINQDQVLTFVGTLSYGSAALYPALEAGGAINFGNYPTTPDDLKNPNSYPFVNGVAGWAPVASAAVQKFTDQVSKVVTVTTDQSAPVVYPPIQQALEAAGMESVVVKVPLVVTDYAPIAAQVAATGADGIVLATVPSQVEGLYNAFAQEGIADLPIIQSGGNSTDSVVDFVESSDSETVWSVSINQDPVSNPGFADFWENAEKYADKVGGFNDRRIDISVTPYLSVITLARVLEELPEINREALKTYMDSQADFSTEGWTHNFDFTKDALPNYPRGFNKYAAIGTLEDGFIRPNADPVEWLEQPSN